VSEVEVCHLQLGGDIPFRFDNMNRAVLRGWKRRRFEQGHPSCLGEVPALDGEL
jgi:hypothetical protein